VADGHDNSKGTTPMPLSIAGEILQFDDLHFTARWNALTGSLIELAHVPSGVVLYRSSTNLGEPVTVVVGGDPAENRLPEPPRAQGEQLRQSGSLVPFAQPRKGERDAERLGGAPRYDGHEVVDHGRDLAVTVWQRDGSWRVGLTLRFDRVAAVVRFDVRVQRDSGATEVLDWLAWESEGWDFVPGLFDMLGSELGYGANKRLAGGGSVIFWRSREGAGDGEFAQWGPVQPSALAELMGAGQLDGAQSRENGQVALVLYMGGDVDGSVEYCGGAFVLAYSSHEDSRSAEVLHDYLARTGVWAMPGAPTWSVGCAILETLIGYWPMNDQGDRHSPYPTTEDLIADLDRVQYLGFDTIYLMPRHPHPSYTTASFTDLAAQYGDGEGQSERFAALIEAIHARGMHVIVDIILHGVLDQEALDQQQARRQALAAPEPDVSDRPLAGPRTNPYDWDAYEVAHESAWREAAPAVHPYWLSNPEWFTQLPDGRAQFTYTRSLDLRHPGFREFFVESLTELVATEGIDGYRFDAPWWNQRAYRWQADSGYRPGWSTGAGRELISVLFDRIQSRGLDALSFVESCDTTTAGSAHLQYPYDETPVIAGLMSGSSSAAEARERLFYLRRVHAQGVAVARWIDSHDSVWWAPIGRKWKREVYGASAVHAATFLSAMRDGAFMMFSGGEEGQAEWISRLLALKRDHDILRYGHCDERVVGSSDDRVLPVLRTLDRRWMLGVTSWADFAGEVTLAVPGVAPGSSLTDLLNPSRSIRWESGSIVLEMGTHESVLLAPSAQTRED
jgi:hypothetical protein